LSRRASGRLAKRSIAFGEPHLFLLRLEQLDQRRDRLPKPRLPHRLNGGWRRRSPHHFDQPPRISFLRHDWEPHECALAERPFRGPSRRRRPRVRRNGHRIESHRLHVQVLVREGPRERSFEGRMPRPSERWQRQRERPCVEDGELFDHALRFSDFLPFLRVEWAAWTSISRRTRP
jgi:hypothetical protein